MTRPDCEKDHYVYFTFWPLLAFSFFAACDEFLTPEDKFGTYQVSPSLMACILVSRTFVHMFAINCLILSIVECFLAFMYVESPLCTRLWFLELDALIASIWLLVLSLLVIVDSVHDEWSGDILSRYGRFFAQFIPWIVAVVTLVYQVIRVLVHHKLIRCVR